MVLEGPAAASASWTAAALCRFFTARLPGANPFPPFARALKWGRNQSPEGQLSLFDHHRRLTDVRLLKNAGLAILWAFSWFLPRDRAAFTSVKIILMFVKTSFTSVKNHSHVRKWPFSSVKPSLTSVKETFTSDKGALSSDRGTLSNDENVPSGGLRAFSVEQSASAAAQNPGRPGKSVSPHSESGRRSYTLSAGPGLPAASGSRWFGLIFDSIASRVCVILVALNTNGTNPNPTAASRYSERELIRRLLALAWRFRTDCIWSVVLSFVLLLLGIGGLKLLGLVIDVIRGALDPALPAAVYPLGWHPPTDWSALRTVAAIAVVIMILALLRAVLTYAFNMITARLTQGEIVPALRAQLYAKLQRLSFSFFDVHGSNSIFNRVTGDVQNTRLFVDGVLLQGVNMLLTLAAYAFFMWRIQPALTLACLSVALPLWWLAHFYSARLRPGYLRNRELTDNMILLFSESVRGMQTVKGFAAEAHQVRRFEAANDEVPRSSGKFSGICRSSCRARSSCRS